MNQSCLTSQSTRVIPPYAWRVAAVLAAGVAAATTPALAATVPITVDDCRRIAALAPAGSADYVPGRDVRGQPVVPAEVDAPPAIELPATVDIEIGLDLADRIGLRDSRRDPQPAVDGSEARQRALLPFSGTARLGTLTISGRDVLWNGVPLSQNDIAAVGAACRNAVSQGEVELR